jgi:hypothetical protein
VVEDFKREHRSWIDAHRTNEQRLNFAVDPLGKLDILAIRHAELLPVSNKLFGRSQTRRSNGIR